MDTSIIAAFSAILGTTVGGLTTFLTTFLNQRYAMRRDILTKDVANREQLYSEFLKEVGNLYFDSVNRTLDDMTVGEMKQPQPLSGEVRIRVAASGINAGDVKKASG